ncbi:MAG: hypothetical protein JST48_14630 [Bacteroidetes bacterium]|nr:hypothetical protein [Bacteroidota bacterium]
MKKAASYILIAIVIVSCSKSSTTPPSPAETNATLLAGTNGSIKTWAIAKISQTKNGNDNGSIVPGSGQNDISPCVSDNLFQFSNNSVQSYKVTEGSVNCLSGTYPSTIEEGNWAFTHDGKSLLIDGSVYPDDTEFNDPNTFGLAFIILAEGQALNVVSLTSSSLVLSYSYSLNSDNYVMTLSFTKVN